MNIADHLRLKDLQIEFQQQFPFLRIEFYLRPHGDLERSPNKEKLDANLQVGAVRRKSNSGLVDLQDPMSTAEFESLMEKEYGLHVQVYRKERGQWYQTWATDPWPLEEQNRRSGILGDQVYS